MDAKSGSGKGEKNEWKEYPSNPKALILGQAAPRHRSLERGTREASLQGYPVLVLLDTRHRGR